MNRVVEIYQETQGLAKLIMEMEGYSSDVPISHEEVSNPRRHGWWVKACKVQEYLNGHEMVDIVEEYTESFYVPYEPISDREALVVLGSGKGVFVPSKSGNSFGYKEITNPVEFMDTCYNHCTVYRIKED